MTQELPPGYDPDEPTFMRQGPVVAAQFLVAALRNGVDAGEANPLLLRRLAMAAKAAEEDLTEVVPPRTVPGPASDQRTVATAATELTAWLDELHTRLRLRADNSLLGHYKDQPG